MMTSSIHWQSMIFGILALAYYLFIVRPLTTVASRKLNDSYDYIIIGGGTAGAVLAARLTEDADITVLLLEAGGDYTENPKYHIPSAFGPLQHSKADWEYYTEPQTKACRGMKDRRNFWASGRVLGGSSVLNIMVYGRGLAEDYNDWATQGCDGWGFEDVFPYFLKSEDILADNLKDSQYHGKGGPIAVSDNGVTELKDVFIKAAHDIGYSQRDYSEMKGEAVSTVQLTIRNGVRSSTGLEYLGRARLRDNLHVSINSLVTKLEFEGKRAKGVSVLIKNKKKQIFSHSETIISAGAINSPALLMQSGIGPSKQLNDLGIETKVNLPVGENLQNHFALFFNTRINQSLSFSHEQLSSLKASIEYSLFGTGYMSVPGVEAVLLACSQKSVSKDCRPDLQFLFFSTPFAFNFIGARDDVFRQLADKGQNDMGFFTVITVLRPKSKGRLTLKSRDPFDHPKIQPDFLAVEEDEDTLLSGIRIIEKLLETNTMRSIGASVDDMRLEICSAHQFRSDAYWRCIIRHVAGVLERVRWAHVTMRPQSSIQG